MSFQTEITDKLAAFQLYDTNDSYKCFPRIGEKLETS